MSDPNQLKSSIEWMESAPPAEWVREMREHYRRTGIYRPKDLRRVMGDQTESVKMVTDPACATLKLTR